MFPGESVVGEVEEDVKDGAEDEDGEEVFDPEESVNEKED